MEKTITLQQFELKQLLIEAARHGANLAMDDMITYNMQDAADKLGISYNTLLRRVKERKIRPLDGRITGAEIRRYLTELGS